MTVMPDHTVRLAETTELMVLDPSIGPVPRAVSDLALGDEVLVIADGRFCFRRLMVADEAPPPTEATGLAEGALSPGIPQHALILDSRQQVGLPRFPTPTAVVATLPGTAPQIAQGFWFDIKAEGAERIIAANVSVATGPFAAAHPVVPAAAPEQAPPAEVSIDQTPLTPPRHDSAPANAPTAPVRAYNGTQELVLLGVVTDGPLSVLRFNLPPRTTTLRLASPSAKPDGDARTLGVALFRLVIEATDIPLDSPILVRGFHRAESNPELTWRWTDGDALLILPPKPVPQTLSVHITDWHKMLQTG